MVNSRTLEKADGFGWVLRKIRETWDGYHPPVDGRGEVQEVQGNMHVLVSHAHGYEAYIETGRCEEKGAIIAKLTAALSMVRQKLEEIIEVDGVDKGVFYKSTDSPSHWDHEAECRVFDHENMTEMGDALIELYELTNIVKKEQ